MVADSYKDTEIGVIPVEWDIVNFKNFFSSVGAKKYQVQKSNYLKNGNYPIIDQGQKFIVGYSDEEDKVYKNTDGVVVFGDHTRIIKFINFDFVVGADGTQLLKSVDGVNQKFSYYVLSSKELTNLGYSRHFKLVKEMKFQLPPLKEQEKIADILSTADEKIDAIEGQIQKAETLKKGLLQKLLSEGIGHSEFKDSELGKIPESWEVVELGKCVKGKGSYGIGAAAVDYYENLPAYLRITDIDENGKFIATNKKCVASPEASNYQLEDGDIVFARTGNTTGKTYLYNPNDGILVYAGFLIKFTPNKELLDTYYLKLQSETQRYWNWVKVTSMRTGQPGINSEEYGKLLIPLPPLKEQKQIADILSTADEKLEVLRAKKQMYETLKIGLLQKLLSGEIRV